MVNVAVDYFRKILECFYEKHQEKLAWVVVATIWAIVITGFEFGHWRWSVVEPCIKRADVMEKQVDDLWGNYRVLLERVSRLEGRMDS